MTSVDLPPDGDPATAVIGRVLLGKLRVDAMIGRGGMGAVYRVTHVGTHHARALKLLHASLGLDAELVARFQREASVSGRVGSRSIVETLDSGVLEDGTPYVLMELLDGESLEARIERGPLPIEWIAPRLARACDALARAHELGIVHRDLKPANLFVAREPDGDERVCILDFGIARFAPSVDALGSLTSHRTVLGTPCYMAPEQLRSSRTVEGSADVYAIGVVLYEALSGVRPYDAESFGELIAKLLEHDHRPLDQRAPGLDDRVYDLVESALSLDAGARPTMSELASSLRALEQPARVVANDVAPTLPPPEPEISLDARGGGTRRVAIGVIVLAALVFAGIAAMVGRGQRGSDAPRPTTIAATVTSHDASAPSLPIAIADAGAAEISPTASRPPLDAGPAIEPVRTPRPRREPSVPRPATTRPTAASEGLEIDAYGPP